MTVSFRDAGCFACFALTFLTSPALAYAADANPTDEISAAHQPLDTLLQERVVAARECLASTRAAYERNTTTLDLVLAAIVDLRAAELDAATTSKERTTAHFHALTAARAIESQISALYRMGARGGEADKFWQSKALRLETEISLGREKLAAVSDQRDPAPQDQAQAGPKGANTVAQQEELSKLRQERRDAASQFAVAAQAAYQTDTITLDILLTALRERFAARVDAAEKNAERLAAHGEFVESTQAVEDRIKALFEAGARGGEAEKYALARTTRLEAQIGLARFEQAQAAPPASAK